MEDSFGFLKSKKENPSSFSLENLKINFENDISENFKSLETRELGVEQIGQVLEYSINDGLVLGQKYQLTPEEWRTILVTADISVKHPRLFQTLFHLIEDVNRQIPKDHPAEPLLLIKEMRNHLSYGADSHKQAAIELLDQQKNKDLEIEKYYSSFLSESEKALSPKEIFKKERYLGTPNELKAKNYLKEIRPFIEGQYLSGEVYNILYKDILSHHHELLYKISLEQKKDIEYEGDLYQAPLSIREKLVQQYLIIKDVDEDTLLNLKNSSLLNTQVTKQLEPFLSDQAKKNLSTARYKKLDITYNTKRNLIEKPLLKELNTYISKEKNSSYEIRLDSQLGKYRVFDSKKEQKKVTERDKIEFRALGQKYNQIFIEAEKKYGNDVNPTSLTTDPDFQEYFRNIKINDYQNERTQVLPIKKQIEIMSRDVLDSTVFAFIENNIDILLKEGEVDFIKDTLNGLTHIDKKYIHNFLEKHSADMENSGNLEVYAENELLTLSEDAKYPEVYKFFNDQSLIRVDVGDDPNNARLIYNGDVIAKDFSYFTGHVLKEDKIEIVARIAGDEGGYRRISFDGKNIIEDVNFNIVETEEREEGLYTYRENERGKVALFFEGRQVTRFSDEITDFRRIDNSLNVVEKRGDYEVILRDNIVISQEYKEIQGLHEIDHSLFSIAVDEHGQEVVLKDGKEISHPYKEISRLTVVNGKPVFSAEFENGNVVALYGNEALSVEFRPTSDFFDIRDELVFAARNFNGKSVIVKEGIQVSEEYKDISYLKEIDGDLLAIGTLDNGSKVLLQNGKRAGLEYKDISYLDENNQGVFFRGEDSEGNYFIVQNNKMVSSKYEKLNSVRDLDGIISFEIGDENGNTALIYDNEKIGGSYKSIQNKSIIDGKILFEASFESNKKGFVYSGKEIGKKYEKVFDFDVKDGLIIAHVLEDKVIKKVEIGLDQKDFVLQEKIDLLNAVHDPDLDSIDQLIDSKEEKSFKESLTENLEHSKRFAKITAKMIREIPKEMLRLNPAKKTRARKRVASQLSQLMIPDAYNVLHEQRKKKEREKRKDISFFEKISSTWKRSFVEGSNSLKPRSIDYLGSNSELIGYQGGNPREMLKNEETVLLSRYELNQEYIARGYYADEKDGKWTKAYIPFDTSPSGFSRENTLTTALVKSGDTIHLPLPVHSSFIEQRVKGVTSKGEEISLELKKDSFGSGSVSIPKGVERVIYSIQESMIHEIPSDVSDLEFAKMKKQLLKYDAGESYFKKVNGINEQDLLFIKSIEALSPKEKVMSIENYVQKIGYYDFNNNADVIAPKRNADSEELFYLMEDRMNELRAQNPTANYGKKRYAGVCDDFSKLTTALLREAGIPSGLMVGFRSENNSKEVKLKGAHATSFVVWKGSDGDLSPYVIDGTPTGLTTEEVETQRKLGIIPRTIKEKEFENQKILGVIRLEADKEIQEVEEVLVSLDIKKIKELENGKLENALNMILAYDVEWSHVKALESVLHAYRFTPLYGVSLDKETSLKNIAPFLQSQLESQSDLDKFIIKHKGSAGSALFNMVHEFILKENINHRNGLEDFDYIFSLIESNLSTKEKRAITVISQYLKAKKMVNT